MTKHRVLIGPMGAGKTTIGRALSQRLALPFFDCDEVLMEEAGCSMTDLIQKKGEAEFRARETAVLKSLLKKPTCVLATGGGVVLAEENRRLLKEHGFIIYLAVNLTTQLQRLKEDDDRPLLQVPDRRAVLNTLNQKRIPHYTELSDVTINVDGLSIETIVEKTQLYLS